MWESCFCLNENVLLNNSEILIHHEFICLGLKDYLRCIIPFYSLWTLEICSIMKKEKKKKRGVWGRVVLMGLETSLSSSKWDLCSLFSILVFFVACITTITTTTINHALGSLFNLSASCLSLSEMRPVLWELVYYFPLPSLSLAQCLTKTVAHPWLRDETESSVMVLRVVFLKEMVLIIMSTEPYISQK